MKEAKNELMQFVAGIIMLVVGLYIFSQKVIVFSGFFSFGGGRFSSGLIVVPLIIGIVWMFVSGANFASKVFTVLAAIIIIASVVILVVTGAVISALGWYEPFQDYAGAGASVPLLGFGNVLMKGVKEAVQEQGFLGLFAGGFKAGAVGTSAALILGYLASLLSKPKMKE